MSGIVRAGGQAGNALAASVTAGSSTLEYLVVGLAVAAAAYFVIRRVIRPVSQKKGSGRDRGCGCGCSGCPQAGSCQDKTRIP